MPPVTEEQWTAWALGATFRTSEFLYPIRDKVLKKAEIAEGDVVLDVGCGDGLIGLAALERVGPRGRVIFSDLAQGLVDHCRAAAQELGALGRCAFLRASADDLAALPDASVDAVTARSVLPCLSNRAKRQALREFCRVLKPGRRLSTYDPINRFAALHPEPPQVFWGFEVTPVRPIAAKLGAFYRRVWSLEDHPSLSFDERDLLAFAEQAGLSRVGLEYHARVGPTGPGRPGAWDQWVHARRGPGPGEPSLAEAMQEALTAAQAAQFVAHLRPLVEAGQTVPRPARFAEVYLWATR